MPDFVTISELAERLRVSPQTVARLCKAGTLEACHVGRQVRIPLGAVERFLSTSTQFNKEQTHDRYEN